MLTIDIPRPRHARRGRHGRRSRRSFVSKCRAACNASWTKRSRSSWVAAGMPVVRPTPPSAFAMAMANHARSHS